MFRSMRWTLQLWHAAILLLALVSFGTALYLGSYQPQMARIDAELESTARIIANMPPMPPENSNQGPEFMWGGPFSREPGAMFGGDPPEWSLPDWSTPPIPPAENPGLSTDQNEPKPWWAKVRQDALHRLGQDGQDQPYCVIWSFDGKVVRSSTPVPEVPLPDKLFADPWPPGLSPEVVVSDSVFRTRGILREVIIPGPFGTTVLVGKSLASEIASRAKLRWILLGVGAAVLGVGLCGGWLLATRAMRPIQSISKTAQAISASDLSQRIDVTETQNELGSLAQTLNDTFDRLETAFQRQIRFTADASHELRTPLAVIYAHTELALTQERSNQEYKQTLEVCFRAAKRMKSLVEMLLVLARADAGKLELQRTPFDLQEAVQECLTMVAARLKERNLTLETQLQPMAITADRTRILQLITNLLVNAINYNRPGGKVLVSLNLQEKTVVLAVSDTGIGISPADQAHLFERFFRADKARSREAGGTGLGLAICQSIVEAHGGEILFRSQQAQENAAGVYGGGGSTFTVRLPQVGLAEKPSEVLKIEA